VNRLSALLRLARISNLPTVWSNVLAASVLAGGMSAAAIAQVMLAMSLLYTGGMFLNDAFDERIDSRERPDRPLPSGVLSSQMVWVSGLGLLAIVSMRV
jgi:4-hydroxybenzoate polyprenyltransferase